MGTKSRVYPVKARPLDRSQRLRGIAREGHARGKAYLVHDKQGRVLVLCQRLAIAVDYLNTHAVTDAVDRLSYASIYESVGARGDAAPGLLATSGGIAQARVVEQEARSQPIPVAPSRKRVHELRLCVSDR